MSRNLDVAYCIMMVKRREESPQIHAESLPRGMAGSVCSLGPSAVLEWYTTIFLWSLCPQPWDCHLKWSFAPEPGPWHSTDVLRAPLLEHTGTSILLHRNVWLIHLLGGVDYTNSVLCLKFHPCSCQYLFEYQMPYHKNDMNSNNKIYWD